jgi:hypothetical protein
MATHSGEDREWLDRVDSALLRAIKGAIWFPLVYLPRQIQASSSPVARILRVGFLLLLWGIVVFGPAMFLGEVDEPVIAMAILAWTLLALVGSIGGVLRVWKSTRARPDTNKPEDLREAFV